MARYVEATLLATLLVACADPGDAGGEGSTGEEQAGTDSITLQFRVRSTLSDPDPAPRGGITVAFDMPGGERVEAQTDAAGEVMFEGIDWSLGEAAVTAHLPDHELLSVLGLTQETAQQLQNGQTPYELVLVPLSRPPTEVFQVRGTAANMEDPDTNMLLVSATSGAFPSQNEGPQWSLTVPPGIPFTLVAAEFHIGTPQTPREFEQIFHGWTRVDHAAISDHTEAEIDFADVLASKTVGGSVTIPDYALTDFFDGARVYAQVSSSESGGVLGLGFLTKIDWAADEASFQYEIEHVTVDAVEQPFWTLEMYDDFRRTWISGAGYPVGGPLATALEPARMSGSSWNEPIQWQLNPVDAERQGLVVSLRVRGAYADANADPLSVAASWSLIVPTNGMSATMPDPPSSVDRATVFGNSPIIGMQVFSCIDLQDELPGCELFSLSDLYPVEL